MDTNLLTSNKSEDTRAERERKKKREYYLANRDAFLQKAKDRRQLDPEKERAKSRSYYHKNAEHLKVYQQNYRVIFREKINARQKKWREKNPDKFKARINRYLSKNPTIKADSAKEYRKKYPAKVAESKRKWNAANPEWLRVQAHRRRSALRSVYHPDHNQDKELDLHRECANLSKATGTIHSVDHIIPIAVGGWHHHLNLQIIPRSVNAQKSGDPFWEMAGYKSWRDVPEFLWPVRLAPSYRALMTNS